MSLSDQKKRARTEAAVRRHTAHFVLQDAAANLLNSHDFPLKRPASVSGFYPYQDEIDVRPLLGKLAGDGWTPCLPVVIAKTEPLLFRRWYPGEPTVAGRWDIPVPLPDQPELDPDVLLVPMLAFDRAGYRLGYGGGFYDRTLAKLRALKPVVAIGVAYAAQEMAQVPRETFDQPLDYIMTETELFQCG